jgi:transposase
MTIEEKIRELTAAGKQQKEIALALSWPRNRVYRWQRKMGLSGKRPGLRGRILTEAQEAEILALLKAGWGSSKIGKHLGVGEHQARLVVKKFNFRRKPGEPGYRYHLSPAKLQKITDEILEHRNFGTHLADKYRTSYKLILKLAHELLACPRFRSGYGEPALSSNFPQKRHRRTSLSL